MFSRAFSTPVQRERQLPGLSVIGDPARDLLDRPGVVKRVAAATRASKWLLPGHDVFDDTRHFRAGTQSLSFDRGARMSTRQALVGRRAPVASQAEDLQS
ncbi:MAG TPA: hypothetical protein VFS67_09945 [Polyangiaceae bacterium]|nr:hypothetical protein [Polyangiaceae bacterium]